MPDELYVVRVVSRADGRQLIAMTGRRETVVEAALKVILDSAPSWERQGWETQFEITAQVVK